MYLYAPNANTMTRIDACGQVAEIIQQPPKHVRARFSNAKANWRSNFANGFARRI